MHGKMARRKFAQLRIGAMPAWMLGASAMFSPLLRELIEMRCQRDRP
jgi:hypothetical protein